MFKLNIWPKINIAHVKQPNAIGCGAMVCHYAEKIVNSNNFFCFTFSHFRDVFRT